MTLDELEDQETLHTSMQNCPHDNLLDPPSGRYLRICADCLKRIIECAHCNAKLDAGPEVGNSGWRAFGSDGATRLHACPACTRY